MDYEERVPNEKLIRARLEKGWTQARLAEEVGTTFETVSRWERGVVIPGLFYREKLYSIFGKTATEPGLDQSDTASFNSADSTRIVFLASAYADAEHKFVVSLKKELAARDITLWSSNDIVCRWMRSHPLRDVACRYDSEENYVAQGFARFWQAMVNKQNSTFQSLGAAMKYLRACLHASVIDTLRTYSRARVVGLPEPGEAGEPSCEDVYDSGELWQAILHLLPGERERRVAYFLYNCGLKPRAIVHFCPEEFNNVQEIYHIRRNIIERLRRNADYRRNGLGYDIFEE